jgi:hypothetical protein
MGNPVGGGADAGPLFGRSDSAPYLQRIGERIPLSQYFLEEIFYFPIAFYWNQRWMAKDHLLPVIAKPKNNSTFSFPGCA